MGGFVDDFHRRCPSACAALRVCGQHTPPRRGGRARRRNSHPGKLALACADRLARASRPGTG
ncbi:hypothetical protein [Lysobacter gummosus]|uniref:hypothetical protein n=1 Tax=Lysobacter gummosus TaxID=262324 RepID=UPI0036295268